MTNTTPWTITAPTITEDMKFAYAEYVTKNDAYMLNYSPLDFLSDRLYADANDRKAYTEYREWLIEDLDLIQSELEIHFENPLFIEAMEADDKFNFIWKAESETFDALNDALQIAYEENDFWVFEEIAHKVFTDDEGTNVEEAMSCIQEMVEEGNETAFADIVFSYFNEGNKDFVKAAKTQLAYFANDILDRF